MSTIALAQPRVFSRRVGVAARMLFSSARLLAGWPLAIMGSSFLINVLIFSVIRDAVDEPTTGGLASIYLVQLVVCWQLLHQFFSFAVGLNLSRRAYYGGVVLISLAQSLFFGVILCGFLALERATGGWGVDLSFFGPLPLMQGPWWQVLAVYTVPMIGLSCVGLFFGAVTKRWGGNGIFVMTVAGILVVGGLVAIISYLDGWVAVGTWLGERSWLAITVGWSLIPTALAAIGAWLVLRRAVP